MSLTIQEGPLQICLEDFNIKDHRVNVNTTFRWMGENNKEKASQGLDFQGRSANPLMQMQGDLKIQVKGL